MMENDVKIPKPKTKFIKVKCSSCGNEQVIFNAATSPVRCLVCNHKLAEPSASRIKLNTKIIKVLD